MQTFRSQRQQTAREELANSVSHGVGLLAAIAVTPVLVVSAAHAGSAKAIVGVSVFALSMILLYLASTLYHALPEGRAKRVFRAIDHGAIFLLIGGTYTPFTLAVLPAGWGWSLFGVVWGLSAVGLALESFAKPHPVVKVVLYIALGWIILIAIGPVRENLPASGIRLLLAGGFAYTLGVVFYAAKRTRYAHFVWHLFVLAGTVCHVAAVFVSVV